MWDPEKYLDYADLRGRPFFELLSRVRAERPRRVVDLGCGPGNLTLRLAQRWPDAVVEASDNSAEMVAAARANGLDARLLDVGDWAPAPDSDVVLANAVLQWVPGHRDLLRRWTRQLAGGAWLAMQVPGNFTAPSHHLARELAASPEWAPLLGDVTLRDADTVGDPAQYAELLADEGCGVDAWETTYLQCLTGPDPVLEWMTGTALRPIKAALDAGDWERFRAQLSVELTRAYPPRSDGTTWFEFRRVFAVAQIRHD